MSKHRSASEQSNTLWQVDVVSGGLAGLAYDAICTTAEVNPGDVVFYQGGVLWSP